MRRIRAASLQARLAWRLGLVLLGAVCLAAGGLAWRAIRTIDTMQDRALQAQAADIARHLSVDAAGAPHVQLPADLAAAYRNGDGIFLYAIYDKVGHALLTSAPDVEARIGPVLPQRTPHAFFRLDTEGGAGPVYGFVTEAQGLRIVVAQGDLHGDALADSVMGEFIADTAWMILPVVAIALWVAVMTIRDGLRPLREISGQAERITPGETGLRLVAPSLPAEVRPLVDAVNRALERLEQGFELQRRFTADVAHELRTPLSMLTARLDMLNPEVEAEGLRRDVARMTRLVEQLMRIARLDSLPLDVSHRSDLRQIAVEAVSDLAPLAIGRGRELILSGAEHPVWIKGNAPALTAAVTNLVENAIAHAPEGGTIEVEVAAHGEISVSDDGPGVPAAEREAIFQRFWRSPVSRSRGAGLGLAIVRETVRAHGGTVIVEDRPGGGAVFHLRLPARELAAAAG